MTEIKEQVSKQSVEEKLNEVYRLIKKYPNDQELGSEIRKKFDK